MSGWLWLEDKLAGENVEALMLQVPKDSNSPSQIISRQPLSSLLFQMVDFCLNR